MKSKPIGASSLAGTNRLWRHNTRGEIMPGAVREHLL
jgi:hypothetical protein